MVVGREAFSLVDCTPEGKFIPNEEAMRWLETSVGAPLCVLTCAGKARQGKSTLLNLLMNRRNGFGVGDTTDACTKGLWCYPELFPCANGKVLFIDTEGCGALHVDPNRDAQLFALALLLSSTFMYNMSGTIDEQNVEALRVVCDVGAHVSVRVHAREQPQDARESKRRRRSRSAIKDQGAADDASNAGTNGAYGANGANGANGAGNSGSESEEESWHARDRETREEELGQEVMPALLCVVRNFTLDIAGSGGATTYMERALAHAPAASTGGNAIRASLRRLFPNRMCATLPPPSGDASALRQLSSNAVRDMAPEFVRAVNALREDIFSTIQPKRFLGKPINGGLFAAYIRALAGALNGGLAPVVYDQWTALARLQCDKLVASALRGHERELAVVDMTRTHAAVESALAAAEARAVEKVRRNAMLGDSDGDGDGEGSLEAAVGAVRAQCAERAARLWIKRNEAIVNAVERALNALDAGPQPMSQGAADAAWVALAQDAGGEADALTRALWYQGVLQRVWPTYERGCAAIAQVDELRASAARCEAEVVKGEEARARAEQLAAELVALGPVASRLEVALREVETERESRARAISAADASRADAAAQIAAVEKEAGAAMEAARAALEAQRAHARRAEHECEQQRVEAGTARAATARLQSELERTQKTLVATREELEARTVEVRARAADRLQAITALKDSEVRAARAEASLVDAERRAQSEAEANRALRAQADTLTRAQVEVAFLRDDRQRLEERVRESTALLEACERELKTVTATHVAEMARARMVQERERAVFTERMLRSDDARLRAAAAAHTGDLAI